MTRELTQESTSGGRDQGNSLAIHHDSISSHHAVILVNGHEVIIRDLGSTNGTFVDGQKVNQQMQVTQSQIIRFGSVDARLIMTSMPENDTAATNLTAIHSLKTIQQEFEEAKKRAEAPPMEPVGKDTLAHPDPSATLVLPSRKNAQTPPTPQSPTPQPKGKTNWLLSLAVIAVIIVLAVVAWKTFAKP